MFRNLLTVLIISTFVFISGCQHGNRANPQSKPKTVPYVEFKTYNNEVLPKLDEGYTIVKHDQYQGPKNKTRDAILKEAKQLKANLVMVKSDFGYEAVSFDIYYLKKTDKDDGFGAQYVNMPLHIRQNYDSNLGCTLGDITYGTPAYNADLHKDDVIEKVDGVTVTSCTQFKKSIHRKKSVKLNVWADGKTYNIDLKLQTKSKSRSSNKKTK